MVNKGTQNQDNDRVTKFLGGLDPEQNKHLNNYIKEILTSPEFADFVKEKLGESISDLNQIDNVVEVLNEELLPAYIRKLLDSRMGSYLEEIDYEQIEKRNRVFNEKLVEYFSDLAKVSIEKMGKLTPEELYTMKQFLKDKYLSPTDMEIMLKETDFKAAYSNVNKKIIRLKNRGFIIETNPIGGGHISKFDNRIQYYKLTSCGLCCVLKEMEEEDIGDPFIESSTPIKIFEVYQDDPLLQLFIHDLIDKKLLSEITDFDIKWIFINYLKQVCIEICKELKVFVDFQKNGIEVGEGIKWNRNLVNNKTEWNRFFDHLLGNVVLVPAIENKLLKWSELVVDPHISKYSCSFYYDKRKYSIDIDTKNKSAKLCINNNEFFKVHDPEEGKVLRKYGEIDVQIEPHCFILKRLSRQPEEYLRSITRRFLFPIDLLKTQLGFSILQLFPENDFVKYGLSSPTITKTESSELIKLAKDEKIIQFIKDFHNNVNKNYNEFSKWSK